MLIIILIILILSILLYNYKYNSLSKEEYIMIDNINKKKEQSLKNNDEFKEPFFAGIDINLEMAKKDNNSLSSMDIKNIIDNNLGNNIKDIYDTITDNSYLNLARNIDNVKENDKYNNMYEIN